MTTNNQNYQPCDQAETLVSYLYGEIGASASTAFQSHLENCAECSAELTSFGAVRSQMAEWRQEEFAPMSAPAIQLPKREVFITDENKVSRLDSMLDSIRAFLTPQVAIGAAGFAAILVFAGLLFAVWSSRSNDADVLASNQPKQEQKAAPTNTAQNILEENIADKDSKEDSKPEAAPKKVADLAPVKQNTKREFTSAPVRRSAPSQKLKDSQRVATKQKIETLPQIYHDEEVDDSLRLADLFDEADTE